MKTTAVSMPFEICPHPKPVRHESLGPHTGLDEQIASARPSHAAPFLHGHNVGIVVIHSLVESVNQPLQPNSVKVTECTGEEGVIELTQVEL